MQTASRNPSFPAHVLPFARRITDAVIELIAPATIDSAAINAMAQDAGKVGFCSSWVLDTSQATGFETDCIPQIAHALEWGRDHAGLQRFVLVVPDAMNRMALTAAITDQAVPVDVVATRQEAFTAVGVQLTW